MNKLQEKARILEDVVNTCNNDPNFVYPRFTRKESRLKQRKCFLVNTK